MTYPFSFRTLVLVFLPLFVLAACDSGGSNGGEINNEFAFTVTPSSESASVSAKAASQKDVSGFSFFYDAENPETGEQVCGIYLSGNESFSTQSVAQGLYGFIARASECPSSGTYDLTSGAGGIESSQFAGVLYEDVSNIQSTPFYVIESGTLTIDESGSNKVSGSVEATGTSYTFTGSEYEQETVTITGTFTAKNVEAFVAFDTPGV